MKEIEKNYNESEAECLRLLGVIQDKVLNLKGSFDKKNWAYVGELNRLKGSLSEINDNF